MWACRFVGMVVVVCCFLLLLLAGCAPEIERGDRDGAFAPTAAMPTIAATEATPISTATATTVTTDTALTASPTVGRPSPLEPEVTTTPQSLIEDVVTVATPASDSTPEVETLLLTAEPVFAGGDVRLGDWSPDGRYLAYFEYTLAQLAQSEHPGVPGTAPGTFTIYDTATGEKCQRYPLSGTFDAHGPALGQNRAWLPNGDFFIVTATGQVFQAAAPCVHDEELTNRFPEPIYNLVNVSPDGQWLLLTGSSRYWLYNLKTQTSHAMAEVTPDDYNNLVWSPDSRHIGVTLPGDDSGDGNPVGGSRVVDVASGAIRARYDWEPVIGIDATYGGPVWLNNNEMLITISRDQGPFFLTVDGDVRPLLPLFDLEFVRADTIGEQAIPTAQLYVEPETGHYHILLTIGDWGGQLRPQLYHSDTNTVEMLPMRSNETPLLTSNGRLIVYRDNQLWGRLVTAVGKPLAEVSDANCISPWNPPATESYAAHTMPHTVIAIYGPPACTLLAQVQLAGFDDDSHYLAVLLATGGRWLAAVPYDSKGFGQALLVIDFAEIEIIGNGQDSQDLQDKSLYGDWRTRIG